MEQKVIRNHRTVGVIVLGDIGRSPRMQYHAYSLRKEGFTVKLLGYNESDFSNHLLHGVEIVNMKQPPVFSSIPRIFQFILKVLFTTIILLCTLVRHGQFDVLLVQNPPAIPTMLVCWAYCKIYRAKLIIDWHNLAYTILSLSCGRDHSLVRISEHYEKYFGPLAAANICVTNAMKEFLKTNWNVEAVTLYDRPGPTIKSSISSEERQQLLDRLSNTLSDEYKSLLRDVPLLISSTSWTEDEDFSILLDALSDYDSDECDQLPPLNCVITGKGPLKNFYMEKIKSSNLKKVTILTPWLEAEDYPRLLACANLGVCLHTSSSGLDLPMKVVDMFGSQLPVCAYYYPCLSELVRHNENGLVFKNSYELSCHLKSWFINYPEVQTQHTEFRKNIKKFFTLDWHTNWQNNVLYMFSN